MKTLWTFVSLSSLLTAGCMERSHYAPGAPVSSISVGISNSLKAGLSKTLGLTASPDTLSVKVAHITLSCTDPAGGTHSAQVVYSDLAGSPAAVFQVDRRWSACTSELNDIAVNQLSASGIITSYSFLQNPLAMITDTDGTINTLALSAISYSKASDGSPSTSAAQIPGVNTTQTIGETQFSYTTSRTLPNGNASDSASYAVNYIYALEVDYTNPPVITAPTQPPFGGITTTVPTTVGFGGASLPGVVVQSLSIGTNGHLYANLVDSSGAPADVSGGINAYCPGGAQLAVNYGSMDTFANATDVEETAWYVANQPLNNGATYHPGFIYNNASFATSQTYANITTASVDISDLTPFGHIGLVPGDNILNSLTAQCQGQTFRVAMAITCDEDPVSSFISQIADVAVPNASGVTSTASCTPAFPLGESSGAITADGGTTATAPHLQITGNCLSSSNLAYIQATFPIDSTGTNEPTPLEAPCTAGAYLFDFSPTNYAVNDQAAFLGGTVTETTADGLIVASYSAAMYAGSAIEAYYSIDPLLTTGSTTTSFYYFSGGDYTATTSASYMLADGRRGNMTPGSITSFSATPTITVAAAAPDPSAVFIEYGVNGNAGVLSGMIREQASETDSFLSNFFGATFEPWPNMILDKNSGVFALLPSNYGAVCFGVGAIPVGAVTLPVINQANYACYATGLATSLGINLSQLYITLNGSEVQTQYIPGTYASSGWTTGSLSGSTFTADSSLCTAGGLIAYSDPKTGYNNTHTVVATDCMSGAGWTIDPTIPSGDPVLILQCPAGLTSPYDFYTKYSGALDLDLCQSAAVFTAP